MPDATTADIPDEIIEAVGSVPHAAFADWMAGDRDSEACNTLREVAAGISPQILKDLHLELRARITAGSSGGGWGALISEGLRVERFLALVAALLSTPAAATDAALTMLAAVRCPGAATHGVLHPLGFFELTKALRTQLCLSRKPVKKSKKSKAVDDHEDDDVEVVQDGSIQPQILGEIELLLRTVPLRGQPDALSQMVQVLMQATSGSTAAFKALGCCLRSEHGDLEDTVAVVFRSLLPALLLATEHGASKEGLAAQREAVDFVCTAWETEGAQAGASPRQAMLKGLQALLQRASSGAPERAEAREHVCKALSNLLMRLPAQVAARYVIFLWKHSKTAKVSARMFAVEMAATALQAAAKTEASSVLHADGTPQTLWRLLIQHIADKATGVRSKALSSLATLLSILHEQPQRALLHLVQQPLALPNSPALQSAAGSPVVGVGGIRSPGLMLPPAPPLSSPHATEPTAPPQSASPAAPEAGAGTPSASLREAASTMDASLPVLGTMLQQRCADERPQVRRAALAAMEAWARVSGLQLSSSQLALLLQRCQDTSSAIRKQAARSLCGLLQMDPQSAPLRSAWIGGVLPLSQDTETSVCDACLDSVLELIFTPLARCKGQPAKALLLPAWALLEELHADSRPLLRNALMQLAAKQRIPTGLASALQALLRPPTDGTTSVPAGVARQALWELLLELTGLKPEHAAGQKIDALAVRACWEAGRDNGDESTSSLRVLTSLARRDALTVEVSASLAQELHTRLSTFDAPPELALVLVRAVSAFGNVAADGSGRGKQLMDACETELASSASAPVEKLQLFLLVAGELALANPQHVSHGLVGLVEALVHGDDGAAPSSLGATAIITLGKFCLGDAELAKRLIPVFMKELAASAQAAVRNNALVALFDLAKQHHTLLDRHLPAMSLAICDEAALVRRQALMLFTQLLLEDHVKWKPAIFRAFCVALADKESSQRSVAHACLFNVLLPRAPLLGFNSFVGVLFQLNGCTHSPHHPTPLAAAEQRAFEMPGEEKQRHRMQVLRALLADMSDEQRLQTTAKLCQDVLAAVPDGQLSLETAHWVLADTLMLLVCKEIKISSVGAGGADEADEEPETAASAVSSAKSKLLSAVARKATVETIVPIVVELKRHLEKVRSPLLKDIFLFLRELLKDHKQHLQDIFARDRQLAAEIEYDLRQLQAQQTPRALQPLSPEARSTTPGGAAAPGSAAPGSGTPRRAPSSKAAASITSRVPTPDRLKSFSVPKLRSERRASIEGFGSRGSGQKALPPVPKLAPPPPSETSENSAPDVVMASPLKEAPPPRQWNVAPSPEKVPGSPSLDALAKRHRGMFDEITA